MRTRRPLTLKMEVLGFSENKMVEAELWDWSNLLTRYLSPEVERRQMRGLKKHTLTNLELFSGLDVLSRRMSGGLEPVPNALGMTGSHSMTIQLIFWGFY